MTNEICLFLYEGSSAILNGDPEKSVKVNGPVVCLGEVIIDFVPVASGVSLAEAVAFKKAAGGAPANVAVGISRLGGSSAFIGKVFFFLDPLSFM